MTRPNFIGVGTFRGHWNATTNSGSLTGSITASLPGGVISAGSTSPLFDLTGELGTGYAVNTTLTAALGDYYKVSVANTSSNVSVNGISSWAVNDFVVYDGGTTKWRRISYSDAVDTLVIGSPGSGSVYRITGSWNVGGTDRQLQYNYGGLASGSSRFTWDYDAASLNVTGAVIISGSIGSHNPSASAPPSLEVRGGIKAVTGSQITIAGLSLTPQTIMDVTIPAKHNGVWAGPVTIGNGETVTVGSGSVIHII
jgi:hypothetical protein